MSKALVLGNGDMLIGFDKYGRVTDFYYPYVGLENHAGAGIVHRIAFEIDGKISWIDEEEWSVNVEYSYETLASKITATNETQQVKVAFTDVVYNEKNIFVRRVAVHNKADYERRIKIFFHQQFKISGVSYGNTGFYEPERDVVVHYKGRRVFLVGGKTEHDGISSYSIGMYGFDGMDGTWRDIEDGKLSENPIEHGPVDSVISFAMTVPAKEREHLFYWLVAGKTLQGAYDLHDYVHTRGPEHLITTASDFWRAWVNKRNFSFYGLDDRTVELFKRSLLILRTQIDNRGGIIASSDADMLRYGKDTYEYVWPRDGAFSAMALDRAGYDDLARKFFMFCNKTVSEDGYMYHKYRTDKSLGSSWHPWVRDGKKQLAIQEDETALILVALWEHYVIARDLEFVELIYNSFIKKATNFLMTYRDPETGLPNPTYDLWEERMGVHTFTTASVFGGLISASNFAKVLGKEADSREYRRVAEDVREALLKYLYNKKESFFLRSLLVTKEGLSPDATFDISSFYAVFRFNVLACDDPRIVESFNGVLQHLMCLTDIGGVVRYSGDMYYRLDGATVPNPWFVTTLWLVQYYIARAKNDTDMTIVRSWLDWVVNLASKAGILSEQINPYTGEQLSSTPLTWSHAEFITTVIVYLEKLEALGVCKTCAPHYDAHVEIGAGTLSRPTD